MTMSELDNSVRLAIYETFVSSGRCPTVADVASHLGIPEDESKAAFLRLAQAHVLVLQPESREVLMANPLSAVPTAFEVVIKDGRRFWGNCIWDALGAIAMLGQDGEVVTTCGCCGESMTAQIRDRKLTAAKGTVHFAVPAAHWWDDIVFN